MLKLRIAPQNPPNCLWLAISNWSTKKTNESQVDESIVGKPKTSQVYHEVQLALPESTTGHSKLCQSVPQGTTTGTCNSYHGIQLSFNLCLSVPQGTATCTCNSAWVYHGIQLNFNAYGNKHVICIPWWCLWSRCDQGTSTHTLNMHVHL